MIGIDEQDDTSGFDNNLDFLTNYISDLFIRQHVHFIYGLLDHLETPVEKLLGEYLYTITKEDDYYIVIDFLENLALFINDNIHNQYFNFKKYTWSPNPHSEIECLQHDEYVVSLEARRNSFDKLNIYIIKYLVKYIKENNINTVEKKRSSNLEYAYLVLDLPLYERTAKQTKLNSIFNQLREDLIDAGFIQKETKEKTFNQLFTGDFATKLLSGEYDQIVWLATNTDLKYFTDRIYQSGILDLSPVKKLKANKWNIICKYFINFKKEKFKNSQFANTNEKAIGMKKRQIDSIIDTFASELRDL